MNSRVRFIVLVAVVASLAAVAGLYFSGVVGPAKGGATEKARVNPVTMTDPFIVNLADTDSMHYAKLVVALQLKDMPKGDAAKFNGVKKAESSTMTMTSAQSELATYAPIRNAIIDTISQFTSTQLMSADGKSQLKAELLSAFNQVAANDKRGGSDDPTAAPYVVKDVYFSDFAVQ